MIQLQKSRVVADPEDVERWKIEFREKHCVVLPKLLEPPLLDFLLERLECGCWRDNLNEDVGREIILDDAPARGLLHFGMNTPIFLNTVREITGCGPLTRFWGRVYRFIPNSGHHAGWHADKGNGVIGMSLNLSGRGYEGGLFQLREQQTERMLAEIANTGWGDAMLFQISEQLQHRVTEVTGEEPKTAFAGWFMSGDPNPFGTARLEGALLRGR
jgi:2-oxoglutarate-Fe(II)-dependent oxygenase superfamily protein